MQSSPAKPREGARAPVMMVARYRSPTTFEYVEEDCVDVSVGGMFIRSNTPAAAGTLLKLECKSDAGTTKIRGVARVVWLRTKEGAEGPSGMGVKFVKLEGQSRAAIEDIVRRSSHTSDAPAHEGEVLTAAVVPHTMTLAEAAASAEPLPAPADYARDARKIWGWTLGGLAVFVALVSSERFHGEHAGLGSVIMISEEAANHAASVHAERAVQPIPLSAPPTLPPPQKPPALPPNPPPSPSPLTASPEPEPPSEIPPEPVAALAVLDEAHTTPTLPEEPRAAKPAARKPRPTVKRTTTAAPQATAATATRVPAGNPMTAATACLQQGDNTCVIAALLGRAKSAQEYELLIETLRAVGRSGEAQKHMATYVARFSDERRAATYKRLLAAQAGSATPSSKSDEPTGPVPTPAPSQPEAPEPASETPSAP